MSSSPISLNFKDLFFLIDQARTYITNYPSRLRISGMTRDLTIDEMRAVAYFEATCAFLNFKGVDISDVAIKFCTLDSEPIDD